MVSAKASGFLFQLQLGSSVLPLSILFLILWILGKLKASHPCVAFASPSEGFPSEPVWRALRKLVSGNVKAFPFGNQSKGICEEGPSGPVKWPLSGSVWKSIA